jgi:hypothetical protein
MEKIASPNGKYRDRIVRGGGEVIDVGWRSNVVVDRCRQLLAALMKGDAGASGVQFLAVGRGDSAWDSASSPALASTEQLVDPAPVMLAIGAGDMTYLDASGNPVPGPTPCLQVVVNMPPGTPAPPPGESSYPLREFALFGTFASDDYMVDYVRHPVINKGSGDSLVRTIRLVF